MNQSDWLVLMVLMYALFLVVITVFLYGCYRAIYRTRVWDRLLRRAQSNNRQMFESMKHYGDRYMNLSRFGLMQEMIRLLRHHEMLVDGFRVLDVRVKTDPKYLTPRGGSYDDMNWFLSITPSDNEGVFYELMYRVPDAMRTEMGNEIEWLRLISHFHPETEERYSYCENTYTSSPYKEGIYYRLYQQLLSDIKALDKRSNLRLL